MRTTGKPQRREQLSPHGSEAIARSGGCGLLPSTRQLARAGSCPAGDSGRLPRGRRELLAESCSRYLGRTTRASPGIIWRVSDVVQSADGIPIAFESAGTGGRALVFIHGWSCDRAYWKAQVPAFADRHRVVALDLAGHGESGGGRAAYTMAAFGADVAAVMDHLGLEDAVLIGLPRTVLQGGRARGIHRTGRPSHLGRTTAPGWRCAPLAFDRTLPPPEALGRITDAFHGYDHSSQS